MYPSNFDGLKKMKKSKQYYKNLIQKWIEEEKQWSCGIESMGRYLKNNRKRHKYLVELCKNLNPDKSAKILDIGRSNLSVLLAKYYSDVTTLGFDLDLDKGGHREIETINLKNIVFDLNECKNVEKWIEDKFDLIIYSEVLEHLYEAPEFSLLFLNYLLKPGGFIICTTPNAASLYRRRKLFFGKNDFDKIRFYKINPGHYREYTKDELIQMAQISELKVVEHKYPNFANPFSLKDKIHFFINNFVGFISYTLDNCTIRIFPSFREYQVLILVKK